MRAEHFIIETALPLLVVVCALGCRENDSDDRSDTDETHTGGPDGDTDADSDADADGDADGDADAEPDDRYGALHEGQYHLGPVDFAETDWPNACAPAGGYREALVNGAGLSGEYLAGVSNAFAEGGGVCDSCIRIVTDEGREITARVVTYGVTNAPGDIDVSPSVYEALNVKEYPRAMTWQFAKCPDTGPLMYEFQTGANIWWTSFWVRNQRVPVTEVAVKSANHADFFPMRRETDGTFNDDGGFGEGAFTLRITGMDGQIITDTLDGFDPKELIVSDQQFE